MAETEQPLEHNHGETLYCTVHPNVATSLRCNKCGRPMCTKCAVQTPVGYRCKECVRGQQQIFYNSKALDPVIQGVIAATLSGIATGLASTLLGSIPWFGLIITAIAGSAVGGGIAELSHRAVGRRRGRYSWQVVTAGIILGALPFALFNGIFLNVFGLLIVGIFVVTSVSAAVGFLRFGKK